MPSAALPGTQNLVLFEPLVRVPYLTDPIDPSIEAPTDPVVDSAAAPVDLLRLVRWRGMTHDGLAAWQAGEKFRIPAVRVDKRGE